MKSILIIGDLIEDHYWLCHIKALCQEMAHPSLVKVREYSSDGGAGLVQQNIMSLGSGEIKTKLVYSDRVSKKLRIGVEELRQWVVRLDEDAPPELPLNDRALLMADIYNEVHSPEHSLVIISDYCKGTLDMRTAMMVVHECTKGRYQKPVLVDTRGRWDWYMGADFVFASDVEYRPAMKNYFKHVIHKAGAKGCYLDDLHIPPSNHEIKPFDVCGAGDVFIAAFATGYVSAFMDERLHYTAEDVQPMLEDNCRWANRCAGVSVGKWGTYVVKPDDL